jgi:hypothetical protein
MLVRGLGRAVAGQEPVAQLGTQRDGHRDRRGGDHAIADQAEAVLAGAERQAADDGQLAAAQAAQELDRIAGRRRHVERKRPLDDRALALQRHSNAVLGCRA